MEHGILPELERVTGAVEQTTAAGGAALHDLESMLQLLVFALKVDDYRVEKVDLQQSVYYVSESHRDKEVDWPHTGYTQGTL